MKYIRHIYHIINQYYLGWLTSTKITSNETACVKIIVFNKKQKKKFSYIVNNQPKIMTRTKSIHQFSLYEDIFDYLILLVHKSACASVKELKVMFSDKNCAGLSNSLLYHFI